MPSINTHHCVQGFLIHVSFVISFQQFEQAKASLHTGSREGKDLNYFNHSSINVEAKENNQYNSVISEFEIPRTHARNRDN